MGIDLQRQSWLHKMRGFFRGQLYLVFVFMVYVRPIVFLRAVLISKSTPTYIVVFQSPALQKSYQIKILNFFFFASEHAYIFVIQLSRTTKLGNMILLWVGLPCLVTLVDWILDFWLCHQLQEEKFHKLAVLAEIKCVHLQEKAHSCKKCSIVFSEKVIHL